MKIIIQDQEEKVILSDDNLNNPNFVDVEFYDKTVESKDNPRGFIAEKTVSLEELKLAVDAFYQKKLNQGQQYT